jgi:ABC-type transporter Mla MlaB component
MTGSSSESVQKNLITQPPNLPEDIFFMNFHTELSGNTNILTIEGELTIAHAAELRTILIKSLESADTVQLRLESVKDVDLSCLQLLCAAHRSALISNKNLTLGSRGSEAFRQAVENAGYSRHLGCDLDISESCLWIRR